MLNLFDLPFTSFYPIKPRRTYSPFNYPRFNRYINQFDFDEEFYDDFFDEPLISYHLHYPQPRREFIPRNKTKEFSKSKLSESSSPNKPPEEVPESQVPIISESRKTIYIESDSRGFQRIREEMKDGQTGKSIYSETRRIGDQSISLHRETDKDGKVREQENRTNIPDDQIDAFKSKWLEFEHPESLESPVPEDPTPIEHQSESKSELKPESQPENI
jgi:hypothetical protein